MTIDLELDDVDAELAASVRRFCDHRLPGADPGHGAAQDATDVMIDWWAGLAALGVLGLGTPEGGGTVTTIAAAMEELGRANAPGPLAATFLATHVLDEPARSAVASGECFVAVGSPALMPWLPEAGVIIEIEGGHAHRAEVVGNIERVETLGGEPWGRATLRRVADLGPAETAVAVANIALAAYLAANGAYLVEQASAYASDRVQFRQPIAAFQAVAHPLTDAYIRLVAARTLARVGAHALDTGAEGAISSAATARLSATRAALGAAFQCHQTYGAMGFTVEGPVGTRSARIRQASLSPPAGSQLRAEILAAHGL